VQDFQQDANMPQVDLKGHTVEELAIAANVSVEVIKTAIKMRQQQLMLEKRNYSNLLQQQVMDQSVSSTVKASTTGRPSTTPFVQKRKVNKHPINNDGHKVCLFMSMTSIA